MKLLQCSVCQQMNQQAHQLGMIHTDHWVAGISELVCQRCAMLLIAFFEKITDTLIVSGDETFEGNVGFIKERMEQHGEQFPGEEPKTEVDDLLRDIFKDPPKGSE